MPELPEVQTIVNDLQEIVGEKISDFFSTFPKAIKNDSLQTFTEKIRNKKILSVFRISKNIALELENSSVILLHLKMTGRILLGNRKEWKVERKNKHTHHVFFLGKKLLEFNDVRKFGTIEIIAKNDFEKIKRERGADPIAKDFTFEKFNSILEKRERNNVKSFLMDQKYIAGIGNIYASEIPFDANMLPSRKIATLSLLEKKILFNSIKKILKKAVHLRGTSFSDYRDAKNARGSYQNYLTVYKRNGKKCTVCAAIIQKSIIGQRSTFYCPQCQK